MAYVALALAATGLVSAFVPGWGLFVAMAAAIAAVGAGIGAYRGGGPTRRRILGAAGISLGAVALALSLARYGLTVAAVDRLANLL